MNLPSLKLTYCSTKKWMIGIRLPFLFGDFGPCFRVVFAVSFRGWNHPNSKDSEGNFQSTELESYKGDMHRTHGLGFVDEMPLRGSRGSIFDVRFLVCFDFWCFFLGEKKFHLK